MSWEELVAAALIGTDRRPVGAGAPPGSPSGLEAALADRGVEDRLLGAAAAWTVARRAGARVGEPVAIAPVEADSRPLCTPAAGARLRMLLEGEYPRVVDEWLAVADRAGVRPPPELVPDVLVHAALQPALHAAALAATGPLGRWLAEREPEWAFVRAQSDDIEAMWARGARAERRALLARLRRTDPAAGRELLVGTFTEETWEDREAFVEACADGLSDADEPFLEAALDDSRQPVRAAAARLLARLPRSRFAARMAERAAPLLRVEDGRLVAELPGAPDLPARRDGLEPGGRRAERLTGLLAATPLTTWPTDLVGLPVADDLAPAVHAGWAQAAELQRDAAWARALWPVLGDADLLPVLPRAEAEALAAVADDVIRTARALTGQWSQALSRAVIAAIRRGRESGSLGPVLFAAYRLAPAVADEVEALRDLGGRDLGELCDIVAFRAAMLRELS